MLTCSNYRTVFDLAKQTKGVMKLEQETKTLDIAFFMGSNPRVIKQCDLYCTIMQLLLEILFLFSYYSSLS